MTPTQVFDLVKRTARMGVPGDNTDQAAADCLSWLTNRSFEFWDFHSWDWSLDPVLLNISSANYEISFPATTGELKELNIKGQPGYLRRYNRRDYLSWRKQNNASDVGNLVGYIPLGRDAAGNLMVRFFDAPSNPVVVEGWSKKRLTVLTMNDAANAIPYFPVDVHDLLYTFVLADAFTQMGDARAGSTLGQAYKRLAVLAGDVESEADLDPKCPPPDFIIFNRRRRSLKGTGVV